MPRARKKHLCPVCGQEPVVKKSYLAVVGGDVYIARCEVNEHCGSHEIYTNAGDTVEEAMHWWDAAVKKWEKRRAKAISESTATGK